jgi:RHS repeat-associated protein
VKLVTSVVLVCALCSIAFVVTAVSQDLDIENRGLKPFGAYEGGNLDSVSMANGSLTLHIPFWSYPQRGGKLRLNYFINFTSNDWKDQYRCDKQGLNCYHVWIWMGNCQTYLQGIGGCLTGGVKVKTDQLLGSDNYTQIINNQVVYFYAAVEPSGAEVRLGALGNGLYRSVDGAGILFNSTSGTIWDRGGLSSNSSTITDPNGNLLTKAAADLSATDTLGRAIPAEVSTADFSNCDNTPLPTTSASTWSLPAPNDGTTSTATIKFCKVTFHVHRDPPPDSDLNNPTDLDRTFIQNIVLPNGTKWRFEYQTNEGNVSKITLPTGGSITYNWGLNIHDPCSSGNMSYGVTSRTVDPGDGTPTGTWNYNVGFLNGSSSFNSTATDPQGNDSVHTMTGLANTLCSIYETQLQTYQGSQTGGTLLKTVQTQYRWNSNAFSTGVTSVLPTTVTTIWPNGTQSKVVKDWDGPTGIGTFSYTTGAGGLNYTAVYGNLFDQKEYDYGSGAAGPLLHETVNSFLFTGNSAYANNNLLDLRSSVQVKDGTGTQMAYTTYGYDEPSYPVQTSGITTQHGAAPNSYRGNQTSVNRWLNTSGGYLSSHGYFYDTGTIQRAIDPKAYTTTYTYSSTFAGAYPTQVQRNDTHSPNLVHHITSTNYDLNSGVVLSATDENSRATNYLYDLLSRPRQLTYPDGGEVDYTYNDSMPSSTSPSVSISQKINSTLNNVKLFVVDGVGRLAHVQHTSDPDGVMHVDTTYDTLGRKATVTNPYRNSTGEPTNGTTQYQYDALGRGTLVTQPDSTTVTTSYTANCSTGTDEAGKQRKSCSDGLGRLTQVYEDPTSRNYLTQYQYDALGNLTCVEQHGTTASASGCSGSSDVGSLWRIRRFTYDSLSRLLTAKNPELGNATSYGTISYAYDANSNVQTKTSPSPNQTGGATTTISYNHDENNRPSSKTYSDSTPAVYFGYDGGVWSSCTTTPPTPSPADTNSLGERTSMCDTSGGTAWTHDNMGRIWQEGRKIIGTSTLTNTFKYTYNLDGSMATLQYPSGRTITYGPGAAGRVLSAKDTANSINYVTAATYAPQGAIANFNYQSAINAALTYNSRLQPLQQYYTTGAISQTTLQQLAQTACPTTTATIMSRSYGFAVGTSDNGNVLGVTNCRDTTRNTNYQYDSLNRITQGNSTGAEWGDTYTVDAWGNLTNMNPITGKTNAQNLQAATATWKNQLNISGQVIDAAGNMTNDGNGHTYTYDDENRIASAPGVSWSYTYDGVGGRVKKCNSCASASGGTLYWTGSGGDTLVETDLAGNLKYEYIFFNGHRVARRDGTTNPPYYYFADHLGSTSVVTNSTGGVQDESDYFPYGGEIVISNLQPQNYKFNGKERDTESGLDEFGARYYANGLGRFVQPDWAAKPVDVPYANFGNPQSLNLYSYVENNPTTMGDPDGHVGQATNAGDGANNGGDPAQHEPSTCQAEVASEGGSVPGCVSPNAPPAQNTVSVSTIQTAVTKNDDGSHTVVTTTNTATFSTEKGHEGEFKGATTSTMTTTVNKNGEYTSHTSDPRSLSYGEAARAMGTSALAQGRDAALPSFATQFGRATAQDFNAHPGKYAFAAVEVLAIFTPLPEALAAIEGIHEVKASIDAGVAAGDLSWELMGK